MTIRASPSQNGQPRPSSATTAGEPSGIGNVTFLQRTNEPRRNAGHRAPQLTLGDDWMAKEELLEFDGTVTEVLPDGNFRVKLDNEHEVLAYTAGKMRKFRIRTGVGDRVIVEMSPYDLQRGRISFRHKGDAPTRGPQQRRPNFRRR